MDGRREDAARRGRRHPGRAAARAVPPADLTVAVAPRDPAGVVVHRDALWLLIAACVAPSVAVVLRRRLARLGREHVGSSATPLQRVEAVVDGLMIGLGVGLGIAVAFLSLAWAWVSIFGA
jgi:hypothetical protein